MSNNGKNAFKPHGVWLIEHTANYIREWFWLFIIVYIHVAQLSSGKEGGKIDDTEKNVQKYQFKDNTI